MLVFAIERDVIDDRKCCNRGICRWHGYPLCPRGAVQRCGGKIGFLAHIKIRKFRKPIFRCSMASAVSYPLENLLKNNTAENGPVMLSDEVFEPVGLRGDGMLEKIDPDRRINENHGDPFSFHQCCRSISPCPATP